MSLSHLQPKHYAASLRALNSGRIKPSEEVLLMASTMYIMYGNLEEPEHQMGDNLLHLVASIKILTERVSNPKLPPNEIIDTFIRPMLPRLEMMFANFMMPSTGVEGVVCNVEPKKPDLSIPFADILDARTKFMQLCCWRWRLNARLQPWNRDSQEFKATRKMFLKWYSKSSRLLLLRGQDIRSRIPAVTCDEKVSDYSGLGLIHRFSLSLVQASEANNIRSYVDVRGGASQSIGSRADPSGSNPITVSAALPDGDILGSRRPTQRRPHKTHVRQPLGAGCSIIDLHATQTLASIGGGSKLGE